MSFSKRQLSSNRAAGLYFLGLWIVAATFLFAALSKILFFHEFLDDLGLYSVKTGPLQWAAGLAIVSAEVLLSAALVISPRARLALQLACALLVLFGIETTLHWSALQKGQCGCFGPLSSSSPGMTLLHQAMLLLVAGSLFIASGRFAEFEHRPHILRIAASSALIAAGVVYSLAAHPAAINTHSADRQGVQVRAVLSATCSHCRQSAKEIYLVHQQVKIGSFLVYLGAQSSTEIDEFNSIAGVHLQYIPVTFRQLQAFSRRVPAIQILKNGEIVKEWVGEVPSAAEVSNAVNALSQNAMGP